MAQGTAVLVLFALTVVGQALTPSSYLTTIDQARLRAVFEAALPYEDLVTAWYSLRGLQLLGVPVTKPQETCSFVKSKVDINSVESLFFASSLSKAIGSCQLSLGGAQKLLESAIKGESSLVDIYYAVSSLNNFALKVDAQKVKDALKEALKSDDTPQSHGYAFLTASQLSGDLKPFYDLIEDIIAQSDEVDKTFLQFEGGLFTTALVIEGAYKLAEKFNKAPTLKEEEVIKFCNYFMSRKHVHQLKTATQVLAVIKTLTENKFHLPIAITLASKVSVSEKYPVIQLRVSDLLGGSPGKMTVTADTAKHSITNAVVLSKKTLKPAASDSALYELNFMESKPSRGFYKLSLSAVPTKPDSRLIGTSDAEVEVKVTTQISVENVEIGVSDKDQSSVGKSTKIQHPNKAANVLEADHHQKVLMKFELRDKLAGSAMTAHQVFVRLTNVKSKQEIFFVAEAESGDTYKFDLDVGSAAKDFGYLSGKYNMDLVVGDAVIENPFQWQVADVHLTFQEGPVSKQLDNSRYQKKPDISHQFREPETTPSTLVSNAFTVLCLVPLLILLVLWAMIGVNVSNFPLSLSAIGFHVGLAAIFGLYFCYWIQLNMFMTLRYLGLIGIPTFLFGNRLLSGVAAKRK